MSSSNFVSFARPLAFVTLAGTSRAEGCSYATDTAGESDVSPDTHLSEQAVEAIKAAAYAEGLEAGRKLERDERAAVAADQSAQYTQALASLESSRSELVEQVQTLLPELVIEGVGRILQAWQPDTAAIEAVVGELLAGFDTAEGNIRVYLHPDSIQQLLNGIEEFSEKNPQIDLHKDDSLLAGECRVEGRFGLADARYSSKLLNLRKVLTDE